MKRINRINAPPVLSEGFSDLIFLYLQSIGLELEFLEALSHNKISVELADSVQVSEICKFLDIASEVAEDPLIGINLVRADFYQISAVQMLLIMSAPSVGAGLKGLVTYNKYLDPSIVPSLTIKPDISSVSFSVIDASRPDLSILNEFLLAALVDCLNGMTHSGAPIREIWFEHAQHADLPNYHYLLGCKIKFNQKVNSVLFDSAFLKQKPITASSILHRVLNEGLLAIAGAESSVSDVVDVASREVARIHPASAATIEQVASNMALTSRTLSRKLADAGTSFHQIKKAVLKARAEFFLTKTDQGLYQIALELGYSDQSAFCRAFKKWFNKTPDQFRQGN